MTVEIRTTATGIPRQYVIGKPEVALATGCPGTEGDAPPDQTIVWDQFETKVYSHEIFNLEEVTDLFIAYFRDGDVDPSYRRRLLSL
ncbi:hypothetical protein D1871_02160 [Nakamurella silvestris]|nr:hypothetical protein D1871_02160 [Nakamurella silvestris]